MHYRTVEEIPWSRYELIMADPPWSYELYSQKGEAKAPQAHYDCMSIEAIARLPVGMIASEHCILWLWATGPMLPQQIWVMQEWGFRFVTSGHWAKTTRHGKQHFGPGYCLRGAGEPFLIGAIGRPRFSKSVRSVIMAEATGHSRKPDLAYRDAEKLAVDARSRIDLFSRKNRPGWDACGHEVGKFDAG